MQENEPVVKTEAPAVEELQKSMQAQTAELEKYKNLLADPSMQTVLSKIAKGEDVKFAEDVPAAEPKSMKALLGLDKTNQEVDLDELSNKDLVGIVSESMEQYVSDQRNEEANNYKAEFEALKAELVNTQQAVLKQAAQTQVKDVANAHPDFEKYRPAMQEIATKYPNMEMEDLYAFAKGKHASSVPGINQLESEKPESSSPFPQWEPAHLRSAKSEDGKGEPSVGQSSTTLRNRTGGRRDFASLVSQAAGRLVKAQNVGGR